ncbi:hypothetical protein NX059_012279 [Plenodomus lindquistii]|nr:hypothetical protein NX059_012279 [Plenodomus lindquistii]
MDLMFRHRYAPAPLGLFNGPLNTIRKACAGGTCSGLTFRRSAVPQPKPCNRCITNTAIVDSPVLVPTTPPAPAAQDKNNYEKTRALPQSEKDEENNGESEVKKMAATFGVAAKSSALHDLDKWELKITPPHKAERDHATTQQARTKRTPWVHTRGKYSGHHVHEETDLWYGVTEDEYSRRPKARKAVADHIGRIMETDLGRQHFGDQRCSHCAEKDWECWSYTEYGQDAIRNGTATCTRCRFHLKNCSLCPRAAAKKRVRRSDVEGLPSPKQPRLAPRIS